MRSFSVLALLLAGCGSGNGSGEVEADAGHPAEVDAAGTDASLVGGDADAGPLSPCDQAAANHSSVGCEYWVRSPITLTPPITSAGEVFCTAVELANDGDQYVTATVEFKGKTQDIAPFATVPVGAGPSATFVPLPPQGIPPHSVALVALIQAGFPCPSQAVVTNPISALAPPGLGSAFDIETSLPTAAHSVSMVGFARLSGVPVPWASTPLRAVASWSKSQMDVGVGEPNRPADQDGYLSTPSWTSVVALANTTVVQMPSTSGTGLFHLNRGDVLTGLQDNRFIGSRVTATQPVGLWVGQFVSYVPFVSGCDNEGCGLDYGPLQAQVGPPWAWGSEYVAARYRDRYPATGEVAEFRLVGAVNGTLLTYDPAPPTAAPMMLQAGQLATFFATEQPFVVRSQDAGHPFYAATYMTGGYFAGQTLADRRGGPTVSQLVPPRDFQPSYTFFAATAYPESDLVVVRSSDGGGFHDVTLDCAGVLAGWVSVGNYQVTHVALSRGNYEAQVYPGGTCDNGTHRISSAGKFGATLWQWGSAATTKYSQDMWCALTLVGPTEVPAQPIEPP